MKSKKKYAKLEVQDILSLKLGEKNMKDNKMSKKMLSGAASVTRKTSSFLANLPCTWWQFQPKTPEAVKKMRKF